MKQIQKFLSLVIAGAVAITLALPAGAEFYNDPLPANQRYGQDGALSPKYSRQFSFESVTADGFTDTLNYRLYVPEDYDETKAYPVILFLHGYGERDDGSNTNVTQLNIGMMTQFFSKGYYRDFPCIIVAPQCPKDRQWAVQGYTGSYTIRDMDKTGDTFTEAIQLCKKAIEKTAETYNVDMDRLYVTGLSMGGYGTWNIITHYPDFFAAAVPICGGGDPSKADLLTDIPIWCFHGDADPTVPVSGTRDMYNAITAAGGTKIDYTEWPGIGHVWYPAYCREDVWAWMFSQSKNNVDTSSLTQPLTELKQMNTSSLNEELKEKVTDAIAYAESVQNGSVHTAAMVEGAETLLRETMEAVKMGQALPLLIGGGAAVLTVAVAAVTVLLVRRNRKRKGADGVSQEEFPV